MFPCRKTLLWIRWRALMWRITTWLRYVFVIKQRWHFEFEQSFGEKELSEFYLTYHNKEYSSAGTLHEKGPNAMWCKHLYEAFHDWSMTTTSKLISLIRTEYVTGKLTTWSMLYLECVHVLSDGFKCLLFATLTLVWCCRVCSQSWWSYRNIHTKFFWGTSDYIYISSMQQQKSQHKVEQ